MKNDYQSLGSSRGITAPIREVILVTVIGEGKEAIAKYFGNAAVAYAWVGRSVVEGKMDGCNIFVDSVHVPTWVARGEELSWAEDTQPVASEPAA